MISIYNELQIRKNESDNLIVFLEQIEHNRFHFDEEASINVTSLRTTLKSTTIIVLYNSSLVLNSILSLIAFHHSYYTIKALKKKL